MTPLFAPLASGSRAAPPLHSRSFAEHDAARYNILNKGLTTISPKESVLGMTPGGQTMPHAPAVRDGQADLDFGLPTKRILNLCREKHIQCFDPMPLMQLFGARVTILPNNDHPSLQGVSGSERLSVVLFSSAQLTSPFGSRPNPYVISAQVGEGLLMSRLRLNQRTFTLRLMPSPTTD